MSKYKVIKCPKCFKLQVNMAYKDGKPFRCRLCNKSTKIVKILYESDNIKDAQAFITIKSMEE